MFHQTAKITRRRHICSGHVAVDVACAALCMYMSHHIGLGRILKGADE